MKSYVFAGQGAQFEGMGKDLYSEHPEIRELFEQANELLGYRLTDIMFSGSAEELKETRYTQPAMFLHGLAKVRLLGADFQPEGVAGHSLGEMTALVAAGALSFEDGIRLVQIRANAVQRACDLAPGTMAAILGLADGVVEEVCDAAQHLVVAANYNCPGQLVISGTMEGVQEAVAQLAALGARTVMLPVGGAFHSPLMEPAREELAAAILEQASFHEPRCPIYQNVNAEPVTQPEELRRNIIAQLTAPVLWTQTIQRMAADGFTHFTEAGGTGKVLQGMIKKVNRQLETAGL